MKKNAMTFWAGYVLLAITGISLVSCSKEQTIDDGYYNQNIPSSLCGTWYEVMKGDYDNIDYLTINTNGTADGKCDESYDQSYYLKGRVYYSDNRIQFYYRVNNDENTDWYPYSNLSSGLVNDDKTTQIIDWTSSDLILADFSNAHFMVRGRTSYPSILYSTNRPSYMVGTWSHHSSGVGMYLNQDGTGTRYYVNSTNSITNWFVRNGYFYIKDGGSSHYGIFRIVQSGGTYRLHYIAESDWAFQKI